MAYMATGSLPAERKNFRLRFHRSLEPVPMHGKKPALSVGTSLHYYFDAEDNFSNHITCNCTVAYNDYKLVVGSVPLEKCWPHATTSLPRTTSCLCYLRRLHMWVVRLKCASKPYFVGSLGWVEFRSSDFFLNLCPIKLVNVFRLKSSYPMGKHILPL